MAEALRTDDRGPAQVEVLPEHVCWTLLRTVRVGRVAFCGPDGRPDLRPLNFVVDGGSVVVRTHRGGSLPVPGRGGAVDIAFEADGPHPGPGRSPGPDRPALVWSVVLRGTATPVSGTTAALEVAGLPLAPYWVEAGDVFLRMTGTVTGRRVLVADPHAWAVPAGVRLTASAEE